MTRLLIPIVLVGAAIGLFVLYTNPRYQATKVIAAEVTAYDDALTKSQELKAIRDKLLSKRNTFSADDVTKLTRILPDNVDNIRLIIDINNIAARRKLTLKDVQLGTVSDSRTARNSLASGASGDSVGSVTVGFSVSASYDEMLAFLGDLEHSLRIIDIQTLDFSAPPSANDPIDFGLTIRTYWLH
jgi:Tfp pilus assembly protein PilO